MYLGGNVRVKRIGIITVLLLLLLWFFYSPRVPYRRRNDENLISLKALLAGAIRAAEMGGAEVIAVRDKINYQVESKGKTKEGVNDPVTAADYRSHCAMYHSLIDAFPTITVISEEISRDCDQVNVPDLREALVDLDKYRISSDLLEKPEDITVWIDPLDATKEFTENLLKYVTTMVCVAVKGVPVIGVVYKPFENKVFWAWSNHATSPNLLSPVWASEDITPVLIVSRSHAGQVKNISRTAFGDNVVIVPAAGAGYKALEVAVGNATAYVHTTAIKKWDVCAGAAIINSLGGSVSSLTNSSAVSFDRTDSTVLANGLLVTLKDHEWYWKKLYSTTQGSQR